jgi:hypothetical protein
LKKRISNSVVKDIIEYSSDDNSDEELIIETEPPSLINNDEPQYVFSYNKFIDFTDNDKDIIERSIYNKLKDNDKMRLLFKPYNTINIKAKILIKHIQSKIILM